VPSGLGPTRCSRQGSTGIIVFFEDRWIAEVDKALAHAYSTADHDVERASAHEVEKALAGDV
jgi:hypothetical protein